MSATTCQTYYFPSKQQPEGVVKGSAHRPRNCNTAAIVAWKVERTPESSDVNNGETKPI